MSDLPQLYSLPAAAKRSGIGVGTLRTARLRGQLQVTEIGGRVYVTDSQLKDMIDRCQQLKKGPASTLEEEKAEPQLGSSETERMSTARVAALAKINALRQRSRTTSRANTSRSRAKASSPAS